MQRGCDCEHIASVIRWEEQNIQQFFTTPNV